MFTFPVFPESFRPVFVFLGSVLKQQDIPGSAGWNGNSQKTVSFDNSQEMLSFDDADGSLVQSRARAPRPFFREGEGKPVFPTVSGVQKKLTLKPAFDLSSPPAGPGAGAAGDDLTGYGADTYKPLRLPH
ncbi:MAG: hypothetical protein HZA28_02350 [Candidatus Omnitrophica bacterium]|nr:hypothetical protein [Candidatus Omnitrophota bacterium]